jgi:hypothetical protein
MPLKLYIAQSSYEGVDHYAVYNGSKTGRNQWRSVFFAKKENTSARSVILSSRQINPKSWHLVVEGGELDTSLREWLCNITSEEIIL